MSIYESETLPREELDKKRKRNVCAICGARLNMYFDHNKGKAFLACWDWWRTHHEGIKRLASPYEMRGLLELNIPTRREIMAKQFGEQKTMVLEKYHGVTSLTRDQAKEILLTVFPDAPEVELQRAVLLCASYSLNPLMGHVFLIPFSKGTAKESWATVIGIKAKRLIASRKRAFSYIDDSPRIMSDKEQIKIFGKVDEKHLIAITILEDPTTGAVARGYGKWEKGKEPYGTDKGNSAENMVFIRSESQALDRLCPGEMPAGVGVIDEQFVAATKNGSIEGEFKLVDEETGEITEQEPEDRPPAPTTEEVTKLASQVKAKLEAKEKAKEPVKDETPVTKKDVDELKVLMDKAGIDMSGLGKMINADLKWKIKTLTDLKKWQVQELTDILNKSIGTFTKE